MDGLGLALRSRSLRWPQNAIGLDMPASRTLIVPTPSTGVMAERAAREAYWEAMRCPGVWCYQALRLALCGLGMLGVFAAATFSFRVCGTEEGLAMLLAGIPTAFFPFCCSSHLVGFIPLERADCVFEAHVRGRAPAKTSDAAASSVG